METLIIRAMDDYLIFIFSFSNLKKKTMSFMLQFFLTCLESPFLAPCDMNLHVVCCKQTLFLGVTERYFDLSSLHKREAAHYRCSVLSSLFVQSSAFLINGFDNFRSFL